MGCAVFTDSEYRFLAARRTARMVSIGPGDAPQIHPVSFRIDTAGGAVEIGGPRLRDSQKYRNIRRDPSVSLIVDDQTCLPSWSQMPLAPAQSKYRAWPNFPSVRQRRLEMGTDIILIRPVRIDVMEY